MSVEINISVNLSNSINWETDYQSLTYTVQINSSIISHYLSLDKTVHIIRKDIKFLNTLTT